MLNLLLKDFKLMFSGSTKLSERIISAVFTILFVNIDAIKFMIKEGNYKNVIYGNKRYSIFFRGREKLL